MKITAMAHLALFGLSGVLFGCAPTGSASVIPVDGASPGASGPPARSAASTDPSQTARTTSGSSGQPSSHSSLQPRSDRPATARAVIIPGEEPEIQEAEWTMSIQPDATLLIRHKGVPVVQAEHVFWAENSRWVAGKKSLQAGPVHGGLATLTGAVPKLDLQVTGTIRPLAQNEVRLDYRFRAGKGYQGIYSSLLNWRLNLKSPSFGGQAPDPVLLENNTGWMWPVGPNQAVVVRFDPPLDKILFERNQKHFIRTFFYADRVGQGEPRVSYTVRLPAGGRVAPSPEERYGPADTTHWFRDALSWESSPIDLSFLNAPERPAGRHGVLKADGGRLVFEDGTAIRFWGANLAANALFATPRENIARQAHRMAQLGYNLMRIVEMDSYWVNPNIFVDRGRHDTRHLDSQALDSLDWWIKCLKDEGIYIWLDLSWRRVLTPADGVTVGFDEIQRNRGFPEGFNYFNRDVLNLMREYQHHLLSHVNRYTRLAYKDDPAIVAVLITNENDLTYHFGNKMLPDHHNPVHNALFTRGYKAFAQKHGLPADRVFQTWMAGPSKLYLGDVEHQFNQIMIQDLRALGVKGSIVPTNLWGKEPSLFSLPPLSDGDIIDIHSYGASEALSTNPRYEPNFVSAISTGRVQGKPLSITEWNVPFPEVDRFTAPLYVASVASLQGWEMPMLYNYSQGPLKPPGKRERENQIGVWSTYTDPALCGVMPAAAVAFRRGHISPGRTHYCLMLDRAQLIDQALNPATAATLRTLVEQSRLTIGLPAVKELPWLKPTETPGDATILTDPSRDFIPAGQSFVRSDTGELLRNWKYGIQTINTPKTQAVSGWIGGKTLPLGDATFRIDTRKAVVALTSLDDQPLSSSRSILITTMARAVGSTPNHRPFVSEPVVGTITLRSQAGGLQLLALGSNGTVQERVSLSSDPDGLTIQLPTRRGTHWYALRSGEPSKQKTDVPKNSSEKPSP
jgi:hypothetical protein